jgi:hypothetical protein
MLLLTALNKNNINTSKMMFNNIELYITIFPETFEQISNGI